MNIVDANVIVRYLLQDAVQFLEQARDKMKINIYLSRMKSSLNKIDFVDSLLFAYSKIDGHMVFTFDQKLNQLLDEL